MSTSILERRTRINDDGTLLLHLPDDLRGQEVEIQVRPVEVITEAELIEEINRPIASSLRNRYDLLVAKRQAETLTSEEYQELQELTDSVEGDHLRRWENLAKVAAIQGTDIRSVALRFGLLKVK